VIFPSRSESILKKDAAINAGHAIADGKMTDATVDGK